MKDKFSEKIIIFTWIIFLFICLGLLSFTSHAASDQDYFPMHQNNNGKFTEPLINYIENTLNSNDNYIFCSYSGIGNPNSPNYKTYEFLYISVPKNSNTMLYGEKNNDLIHFSLYKVGSANPTGGYIKYNPHFGTFDNITYSGILNYFQNLISSNYDNNKDYVSNFQVMTNNTSSAHVVLFYDDGITVPEGDTAREDMDMPDISDYVPDWSNPPTFDNSTVENALSSINDTVQWLGSNLKNTIQGGFNFVGDTVRWGLQKVLDRISDTAQSLLSGIQTKINEVITTIGNKLEDIKSGVSYITQPVSGTVIYDNISGTSLVSNINTINTSLTSFQTAFNNVSEPSTFKIPIHLENLPVSYFGIQEVQYIDLGILGSTEKGLIRTFMWALITYSLFITIVDSISNYINGGGDES